MIDHSTSASAFFELRQDWHQLLEHSAVNEIFLTPEYQAVWWQTLGKGELKIISFRLESGKLVGLAPLLVENNTYSFIGCKDVSDYLDFIVHQDYQDMVYQAIFTELKKYQEAMFSLCSLPEHSPTINQISNLLIKTNKMQKVQQTVCPQLILPPNWEIYLSQLKRKQRQEIRRKWKKLEDTGLATFVCLTDVKQIENAIPQFIELHQLSSETKREFWDPHHQAFFEQLLPVLARHGWLKLFFLSLTTHPDPIATMLVFDYGGHYDLYNSGFNPAFSDLSPGQVLTAYTIRQAIEQGKELYDFLRGDEEYKFRFGGIPKPIFDLSFMIE